MYTGVFYDGFFTQRFMRHMQYTYPAAYSFDRLLKLEGENVLEVRVQETVDDKVGAGVQNQQQVTEPNNINNF